MEDIHEEKGDDLAGHELDYELEQQKKRTPRGRFEYAGPGFIWVEGGE